MEIKSVPIDSLTCDPQNARKHGEKNLAAIKASLKKFGQVEPIVVNKRTGIIVGGNGRIEAMKQLGFTEAKTVEVDLDNTQAATLAIALNRTGELAEWDQEILGKILHGLQEDGLDLVDLGFELKDLADFDLDKPAGWDETKEDEVPIVTESICKPGDLWLLGNHRLLCGDSTKREDVDRLMNGEKADMVFTDPPYGVSFVGLKGTMYSGGKKRGSNSSNEIANDDLRGDEITKLFRDSLLAISTNLESHSAIYIFYAINRHSETIPAIAEADMEIRNYLVWDKGNVGYHAMGAQYKPNYESFLYCHIRGSSPKWNGSQQQQTIWRHDTERLGLHPTMKPVSLIEQAINNHESNTIIDPFLGSGSTLIACEKTNRRCFGMEIDPHYCDVIVKRWQDMTGKVAVKL